MDILFFFLQAILAVGTHYYAPKHYYTPYLSSTATILQQESQFQEPCFIAHAQMSLRSIMEIEEKLRGGLWAWEGRAVDGKLKSSLEWPYLGGDGPLIV